MKWALILTVFLLWAAPAEAKTIGAGVQWCEEAVFALMDGEYTEGAIACINYTGAIYEVFTSHILRWPACPKFGVDGKQFIVDFLEWAYKNEDVWDETLLRGMMAMITEYYPCR